MSTLEVNNIKDTGSNSLISSDGSGTFTINNGVLKNTPAFQAYLNTSQSIPNATYTKAELTNVSWDTDSAFDNTTNYRFTVPSGKAGKYAFYGTVFFDDLNLDDSGALRPYLNGNSISNSPGPAQTNQIFGSASAQNVFVTYYGILDLAVGDYVELFLYQNTGAAINARSTNTQFGGYKLIGA